MSRIVICSFFSWSPILSISRTTSGERDRGLGAAFAVRRVGFEDQRRVGLRQRRAAAQPSAGHAADHQLDFPVVYASAKQGGAALEPEAPLEDLRPLLETILEHAPPPEVDPEGPVQFQAVTLGYDEFLGRLVIGRVERGRIRRGATVVRVGEHGELEPFRVTKLFGTRGLERVELEGASAGDVVMLAGLDAIEIGDTICDPDRPEPLPRIAVDPPTLRVSFSVNIMVANESRLAKPPATKLTIWGVKRTPRAAVTAAMTKAKRSAVAANSHAFSSPLSCITETKTGRKAGVTLSCQMM